MCYSISAKLKIYQFLTVFFNLYLSTANAQVNSLNYDYFTIKDGLPSEQIYTTCQDKTGFLWIGTDAGVCRYDGKTFTTYGLADGLGDNEITEIFEDRTGRIWFIPFSGQLSYYFENRILPFITPELLPKGDFQPKDHFLIVEDAYKNIYISKAGTRLIIKLDPKNQKTILDLSPVLKTNDYFKTFLGNAEKLFVVTNQKRLLQIADSGAKDLTPEGFLKDQSPYLFFLNHRSYEDYVLFADSKGISSLSSDGNCKILLPRSLIPHPFSPRYIEAKFDAAKNLWTSHLLHNSVFFKYQNGHYLQGLPVLDSLFSLINPDKENNIWFATNNGLYKINSMRLHDKRLYYINQNLMSGKVISCLADRDSGLWFGYRNGHLSHMTGCNKVIHYNLNLERKNNNRITSLKSDTKGNILVGTDESVFVLKRTKAKNFSPPEVFITEDGLALNCNVKNIFFNHNGEAFIADVSNTYKIMPGPAGNFNRAVKIFTKSESIRCYSSFYDIKQRLFTSVSDGLWVYEGGILKNLSSKDDRLKVRIQDYAESGNGIIFLATYNNGLIALKDKKVVATHPTLQGKQVVIRRIYLLHDTIYLATNRGVGVLTFRDTLFHFVKLIDQHHGLSSSDVNDLICQNHLIYAATSGGVYAIENHTKNLAHVSPPNLIIQNCVVDDTVYNPKALPNLSYKTRFIRINFVAPVMDKQELTQYRYRFNGSETWKISQDNFIEFSKLNSGKYHIEIQAKKHNSDWSDSQNVHFTIQTAFYNTYWFIALVIVFIIILLFFAIRSYYAVKLREQVLMLRQKEVVEKERNRIAADIHDDIGAELTNIALLSGILKQNLTISLEESFNLAQKIQSSSGQVIAKMNEVIWTLNPQNSTFLDLIAHLRAYVLSLNEHHNCGISITTSTSETNNVTLSAGLRRQLFLIVKELLQNAVKHSGAKQIIANMDVKDQKNIHINYYDNGKGFALNEITRGNGLNNFKKRTKDLNGLVNIDSSPGKGCHIQIILPLNYGTEDII